jgi:hypothetical protein
MKAFILAAAALLLSSARVSGATAEQNEKIAGHLLRGETRGNNVRSRKLQTAPPETLSPFVAETYKSIRVKAFVDTGNVFWDRYGNGEILPDWTVSVNSADLGTTSNTTGVFVVRGSSAPAGYLQGGDKVCIRPPASFRHAASACSRAGYDCVQTMDSIAGTTFPHVANVTYNPANRGIIWVDGT